MDRTDPTSQPPHNPHHRPSIRLTGTDQSEHDALAELFLGDAPFAPEPMGVAPTPHTPSHTPSHTASHADLPAGGPPATTIKPNGTPASHQAAIQPANQPQRGRIEGTAVRAVTTVLDRDADRPVVELVILGHLPVRASLWVRQYACLSARKRSETVALVRSAGGSVSIDVITGRSSAQIEPVDSIEDGVTIATTAATRVVLRVDETVEPELLERAGIDEVTILTGADEAAVVASYRLIKTLVASLDDRLDPEAGPRVRVAVMGNPGPEIDAARQKITRACTAFLDRPVEILDASGRIDATGTVTVCRSDEADASDAVLDALLGTTDRPRPARSHEPFFTPASTSAPDASGPLRFTDHTDHRPVPSTARPKPAGPPAQPHAAPEIVVLAGDFNPPAEPAAADRVQPSGPAIVEPKITRLREPLACLIEGLTPIEARCPSARGVELACDDTGRLHAVTTDARGAGEAVAALLAASAWARANLGLLIRAEPSVSFPSTDPRGDDDAVLHLLARRPNAARAVLDTDVVVYALASVIAGGEEIMVATPLNDD